MDSQVVGPGPGKVLDVTVGFTDHEVDVQNPGTQAPESSDQGGPVSDVGDVVSVHDVQVEPVGARLDD